jgi:hypothetical protein
MKYEAINFRKKFGLFNEQWQPKVIAEILFVRPRLRLFVRESRLVCSSPARTRPGLERACTRPAHKVRVSRGGLALGPRAPWV